MSWRFTQTKHTHIQAQGPSHQLEPDDMYDKLNTLHIYMKLKTLITYVLTECTDNMHTKINTRTRNILN